MDSQIVNLLNQAAARYGVDPSLAVAVAEQESGGNPNAVSSAGAIGVMQLMPATAAALGVANPFDAAQNIDGGVRYLSQLLSQFGDLSLALAAYNWGPGNVAKNGYQHWPSETKAYVSSITARIGAVPPLPAPPTIDGTTGQIVEASMIPVPAVGGINWGSIFAVGALVIGIFWIVSVATD
jgi:soluble lytic murein transglycosylase-like protein